jgi:hypothetical protein
MIFFRHWDGISRRRLSQREAIGSATIEHWFQHVLKRLAAERRTRFARLCWASMSISFRAGTATQPRSAI